MNPFNLFNNGKKDSNNDNSGGSQVTNMVKGLFKNKFLVPIVAGVGGFFVIIIAAACLIVAPIAAVDTAINGIKDALDEAGEASGDFFESLGNFFTTGYWGSDEDVFYKVVGEKYEEYKDKNIDIDLPLVLSAVFIGNDAMVATEGDCTIQEPEESDDEDSEETPNITYECEDGDTEQKYSDLRKEADKLMKGMVDGDAVKSEEEYREWLYDNFIEDKLKDIGVKIPKDEDEKEKLFNDLIDQIYFNRDMYLAALDDFQVADSGAGVCSFDLNLSTGAHTVSNVKVRLLGCTASGGSSGPLEDEELVDLEKYVLGVTYTENGGAPDEAIKMQAIAARSFVLARTFGGEVTKEDGYSIINIRNCTWDQAYCDPDEGCWSDGLGGEYGNTIHTGYDQSKYWSKAPLPEDDRIRSLVAETTGQVIVDEDGNVIVAGYMAPEQNIWNNMANQGKSVADMVKKTYSDAVEITSNCTGGGDGTLTGNPDFSNDKAWKSPSNAYAPTYYGQCTWFAWGRFYEIYGYDPGFNSQCGNGGCGNGYQCVDGVIKTHPDKFEKSRTPKVGAVGSSDYAHNHVFIVTGVDGDQITIQEGNLDGKTNPNYNVAIKDWQTVTRSMSELRARYGDVTFANPKKTPK